MRRIIKFTFVFILSVLSLLVYGLINNNVNAEGLVDSKGYSVVYPGTSTVITVPEYKKQTTEFRATWVSFFAGDVSRYSNDDQMKDQLITVLNNLEKYNMNAIMFHIRTHNDAMYSTDLAPQSSYVRGMDYEAFDYLEWFINECHKRGIEFHAWLNPYRISSSTSMADILSKYKDYPNNPAHDEENILINSSGAAILDPGRPAVQDYIVDVCMEIIEKYDVDAIHFDDYFYISDVDDSETRKLYNTGNLSLDNFRRKSVDDFIHKLSDSMNEYNLKNNKCVQLGISPSGIYDNYSTAYVAPSNYKWDSFGNLTYPTGSYSRGGEHSGSPLYCDTKKWIDSEWIDYICPQVYYSFDTSVACYASVVEWWNGVVKNKKVNLYIGLSLYKKGTNNGESWHTNENEWYNQLRFNQKNSDVDGTCVYQYKSILKYDNTEGSKKVKSECFTNPTKLPVLERYAGKLDTNLQVNNLKLYKVNDNIAITWDRVDTAKNYLIYQYGMELDLNNPEQLIGMSGNDDNCSYCIYNIEYDKSKGSNFAIIPLNEANELCKEKAINVSQVSVFDDSSVNVVEFGYSYITGIVTGGAKLNLRFTEATVRFGNIATYEVYMVNGCEWDESKKQKLELGNNGDTYFAAFTMSDHATPITLKIIAKTEFGTQASEEIHVNLIYTDASSIFKDVLLYVDEMINYLFN